MVQQLHRAWQRTKSKQKQNQIKSHSNWSRVLLSDLAYKQCNCIIQGWVHGLTSESKGKFLVYNICVLVNNIYVWLSMMSGYGTNPIFFNKKKDWTSRTLVNPPTPLRPITSHFFSYPPPTLKVDVICISPLRITYNYKSFSFKDLLRQGNSLPIRHWNMQVLDWNLQSQK